jgi:hypothetical protein
MKFINARCLKNANVNARRRVVDALFEKWQWQLQLKRGGVPLGIDAETEVANVCGEGGYGFAGNNSAGREFSTKT